MTMLIIGMNVKVLARTGPFFLSALALVILALRNVSSYLYLLVVVSSQVSCDDEQIVTTDEEGKKHGPETGITVTDSPHRVHFRSW